MKLIFAIVNSEDSNRLIDKLAKQKIRVTKLSSTGGFLRIGNSTLLIGAEEQMLDGIIEIIRDTCKSRKQTITTPSIGISTLNIPMEITVGGATVFVVDVDRYEKI